MHRNFPLVNATALQYVHTYRIYSRYGIGLLISFLPTCFPIGSPPTVLTQIMETLTLRHQLSALEDNVSAVPGLIVQLSPRHFGSVLLKYRNILIVGILWDFFLLQKNKKTSTDVLITWLTSPRSKYRYCTDFWNLWDPHTDLCDDTISWFHGLLNHTTQ